MRVIGTVLLVLLLGAQAEAGCGGGRSGESEKRRDLKWNDRSLPVRHEEGYGARELPIERLADPSRADAKPFVPTIVWFHDRHDEKINKYLYQYVHYTEDVLLTMSRFATVRIDVEKIRDETLRKQYARTPTFLVLDPRGKTIARISGKACASVSRYRAFLAKAWARIFAIKQKEWLRAKTKILDRLDHHATLKGALKIKKANLGKSPSAIRDHEEEMRRVSRLLAEIEKDEAALDARVILKPEYAGARDEEDER